MSELKEIAAKLFKNLSDAFLRTAYELEPSNSQASIIESIFIENPKIESLATGDQVLILVKKKRFWAQIISVKGDLIEVENKVIQQSWVVTIDQIIHLKKG